MTLVTNTMASNDEPFVSAAYARYRRQMLQMGVQIYEVSPRILRMDSTFDDSFGAMLGTSTGRLHAKMMVIDHETTVVGSMNLDFRSSRANTELGLFVDSPELAADVTSLVDELRSVGTYRMRLGGASGHRRAVGRRRARRREGLRGRAGDRPVDADRGVGCCRRSSWKTCCELPGGAGW